MSPIIMLVLQLGLCFQLHNVSKVTTNGSDFHGPVKNRSCTDVLFLVLMAAFLLSLVSAAVRPLSTVAHGGTRWYTVVQGHQWRVNVVNGTWLSWNVWAGQIGGSRGYSDLQSFLSGTYAKWLNNCMVKLHVCRRQPNGRFQSKIHS